jgi:hypothetical protein
MASPREFVKVWQESASLAEVAAKTRTNKDACRVRAYRYRRLGVPLKEFPPVVHEVTDWDALAQFAVDLAAGQPVPDPAAQAPGPSRHREE